VQLPSQYDRYAANPSGVKAAGESALSVVGNALLDLFLQGGSIRQNPQLWAKAFGNKEDAEELFRRRERAREDLGGGFKVSQGTQEIQNAFIEPIAETASNLWGQVPENLRESIESYVTDPRVAHTAESSILAAPIFTRLARTIKNANFKDNLSGGGGGNQKGFLLPAEEAIERTNKAGMGDLSTELAVKHQTALQMLANKESPGDIAKKTGFQVFPDRNGNDTLAWEVPGKFERGDYQPDFAGNPLNESHHKIDNFQDFYKHPMLYDLVPELKDVELDYDYGRQVGEGGFNSNENKITLGTDASRYGNHALNDSNMDEIFLAGVHEIAHKGQKVFDQPTGGSKELFETGNFAKWGGEKQPEVLREIADALFEGKHASTILNERFDIPLSARQVLSAIDDTVEPARLDAAMNQHLSRVFRNNTSTDFQKYRQMAGEAHANMDMKRQLMSDQERIDNPVFWDMAEAGGVDNPRLLRYVTQEGKVMTDDMNKSLLPGKQRGAISMFDGSADSGTLHDLQVALALNQFDNQRMGLRTEGFPDVQRNSLTSEARPSSRQYAEDKGYWHPVSEDKLTTPIDQLSRVISDWGTPIESRTVDIADLQGQSIFPLFGDRSQAGVNLHAINNAFFDEPVKLTGGYDFMNYNPGNIWASAQGKITKLNRRAQSAMDRGKDAYGVFMPQKHSTGTFNDMTLDATRHGIEGIKATKKTMNEFNKAIRDIRPEWTVFGDPKMDVLLENNGAVRQALQRVASKKRFTDKGFPSLSDTLYATTDPELMNTPLFHGGQSIGKASGTQSKSGHGTYNTNMGGDAIGGFEKPIPPELMFIDAYRDKMKQGGNYNTFKSALYRKEPVQDVTQELVDIISTYLGK
jgi:hypothetical protein